MGRSLRSHLALTAIAVLAGGWIVGCGGSGGDSGGATASGESDAAQLQKAAAQFKKYTLNKNAKGICSLFEPTRMKAWIGDDCVKIFKLGLRSVPKPALLKVKQIKVNGDKAEVEFGYGNINFQRIDGTWYLETPEVNPPTKGD